MKNLLPLFLLFLLVACGGEQAPPSPDAAFQQYIKAYTAGHQSRTTPVRIVLDNEYIASAARQNPSSDWFDFEPDIEGTVAWKDQNVLEFTPAEPLPSGQAYKASFDLGAVTSATSELSTFRFGWRTYDQGFRPEVTEVSPYDLNDPTLQYIRGVVNCADVATLEEVSNAFTAKQSGATLAISWSSVHSTQYAFVVDSVRRQEESGELVLLWADDAKASDEQSSYTQRIAGLNEFSVLNTSVVQQPDQHLLVILSDPLPDNMDPSGFFMLNGADDLRVEIEGTEVRIYPNERLQGDIEFEVSEQLKSYAGFTIQGPFSFTVSFESLKPAVRVPEAGRTLLPSGNNNAIAFEAVNLSAVDVRVIRIFEKNIRQFLQVSELNDDSQLKRVGRIIRRKTVELGGQGQDLGSWSRFYLDLSELIEVEPGAIYHVEFGFRQHHSLYPCAEAQDEETELQEENWDSFGEEESSFWDYFDEYYYSPWSDSWYGYDWYERDNPCHVSYYRSHRFASRNVLATDLGVTAKSGSDGKWHIWATNLMTAAPRSGVEITCEDYQGQRIATGTTNQDGYISFDSGDQKPFLLTASQNTERSYVKLASNNALSLSQFDVSGQQTEAGLKGFIYGERGVWRPGDTLFISFMLEEKARKLPANHPVTITITDATQRPVFKDNAVLNSAQHLSWRIPTDSEAPTGRWQAVVEVGSARFVQPLRVEMIKPNRLKIDLDFGTKQISAADRYLQGDLHLEWLHGAPARNLKAVIEMGLLPRKTNFGSHPDYTFDDPTRKISNRTETIFEGTVDSNGDARIGTELSDLSDAPGMLNAVFDTRAFEQGGDFSIDSYSIPLSPFNTYVGIRPPKGDKERGMLLTDTTHTVDVVTVNADGEPVSVKGLTYSLYKVKWRWWWSVGEGDLSDYFGDNSTSRISSGVFNTDANGKGEFNIRVNYPDWGRYLIRVESPNGGHATGQTVYIDWPGWANKAQRENPEGETMLMVSSDKSSYLPGERATLRFPGAENARALVTVENGSSVLFKKWIDTDAGITSVDLDMLAEYAPNVFASVSLIQPHGSTENDNPIRMYGVTRLSVNDPATDLNPVIRMPDTLEPEQQYEVTIAEREGKGMSYTLAVVDEGLLGLTRFTTPDPHGYFYAPEALGVQTWDLFDEVIGAYGAVLRPLLSIGGGAALDEAKKKVQRFKPVVTFVGPFTLKAGETRTHQLSMPNYVGAVRTMVVARNGKAYGSAEKEVKVKKPLMVLATLPRVLSPGEEVELPATIFAMEKSIKNVDVSVNLSGALEVVDGSRKQLTFKQTGDQTARFLLRAGEREGTATVEVRATSGGETARYKVDIEVTNPNAPITNRYVEVVPPGESRTINFDLPGAPETNSLTLETSNFAQLNLGSRLDYLISYPYGCLEQTISRGFPQLYLADAVKLSKEQEERSRQHVSSAVDKVRKLQQSNGGFTYWPTQTLIHDWSTSYAGHFLIEAKNKGYNVPQAMIDNWTSYQQNLAKSWRAPTRRTNSRRHDILEQSYRLYTLALAGKPELSAMNRLAQSGVLTTTARWTLAAAYILAGKQEAAERLFSVADNEPLPYDNFNNHFGTTNRDRALIAEAMLVAGKREEAGKLLVQIADRLNTERWLSTHETSFMLVAVGRYLSSTSDESVAYAYTYNGERKDNLSVNRLRVHTLNIRQQSGNQLTLTNEGEKELFVQLTATGKPIQDQSPATSTGGVQMNIVYEDLDGNPIDVTRLEQGTDFIAEVTVSCSKGYIPNVALTQAFPSGWEILNDRLLATAADPNASAYDYRNIRDDRIHTFFGLSKRHPRVFRVRLNAAYLGRFVLPASTVEAMYDGEKKARTRSQWIEVVPSGLL